MKLEDMKSSWKTIGQNSSTDNKELLKVSEKIRLTRCATALDRLAHRYRRFAVLSLCIIPMSTSFLNTFPNYQWLFMLLIDAFAVIASLTDYSMYKGISSIDVCSMPVSTVSTLIFKYKRRHQRFVVIAVPCVFTLIGAMAYVVSENYAFTIGLLSGAVFGAIIGVIQYLRFMSDYRAISWNL